MLRRATAPQGTSPAPTRFAHAAYFESDPGWETAGGWGEVAESVYRLEAWYATDAAVAAAPWAQTSGHLRARVMAVPNGDRPQTVRLLFDYQDVNTWTLSDGLGRVVQTQAEAASGSQSILVNREYDGLGNLKRESLPLSPSGATMRRTG